VAGLIDTSSVTTVKPGEVMSFTPLNAQGIPDTTKILEWIDEFPELAGQNKTPHKQEGTSFGDLSIIAEFNKLCKRFPAREIYIWSLDQDLKNYYQKPK
jgi:hypothetical protein